MSDKTMYISSFTQVFLVPFDFDHFAEEVVAGLVCGILTIVPLTLSIEERWKTVLSDRTQ
jgi:hypothetical protein